jgi:hypothetical protein
LSPWHYVFLATWATVFFVTAGYLIGGFILDHPRPSSMSASCDRVFAEFMATNDPVIVNRDGWLLYKFDCNVSRRYRKLTQ